ncbi:SMC (structural maintenance of chromosomes) domain-containing protein [Histoplasma capsulatum G186AR]|nr:SMC (structural maintenance of chromosomes) domain-containing protein [Histoplasma capsulatum]QSS74218.1 SMC (structural maintenance of chromosomes) domain-containing protein [Histoplasma capsulatum G186AR]
MAETMDSPLSILTPSKRNSRPLFSPGASTPRMQGSPTVKPTTIENADSTTPMKSPLYNDENRFPSVYDDSPARFELGDAGGRGGDMLSSARNDSALSSPFQPTVFSESTHLFRTAESGNFRLDEMQEEKLDSRELMHSVEEAKEEDLHGDAELPAMKEDIVGGDDDTHPIEGANQESHETETDTSMLDRRCNRTNYGELSNITTQETNNESMSTIYQGGLADNVAMVDNDGGSDRYTSYDQDDTRLSTFSAIPNIDMTTFDQLRRDSPMKRMRECSMSPQKNVRVARCPDDMAETPNTIKRRGIFSEQDGRTQTPGRNYPRRDSHMSYTEITDQIHAFSRASYAAQGGYHSPSRRQSRFSPAKSTASGLRSPSKFSLLDLDIPPAPTPRSIPSITPRELESLKSSFLSEISSLKATLSGRDAEVKCLKESVSDAERRVGEVSEELRNESARREAEQQEWDRRGKEMETVLRGVRDEIVDAERERERLNRKIEEGEKCKEKLEGRVVELESQLSAARNAANSPPSEDDRKSAEETAKEVQDAVEKVARELHALYKGKHETKVAALKKSYEARWEKRVRETERKLKEALEENERLRAEKDSNNSGGEEGFCGEATFIRETESLEAEKRVLEARVKGLEQEIISIKGDCETLRSELKQERAEKGELVAAVDEWLAIQQYQHQQQHHHQDEEQAEEDQMVQNEQDELQRQLQQQQPGRKLPEPPMSHQRSLSKDEPPTPRSDSSVENSIQKPGNENYSGPSTSSIGRIQAPSSSSSAIRPRNMAAAAQPSGGPTPRVPRFGMPPPHHSRGNSGSGKPGGIPAVGAGRSGIMSSIERMGRGAGAL